jgi:hypothetical protein
MPGPLEALHRWPRCSAPNRELSEGMVRVTDRNSAPIAIATPLPGERERPCEIVTPPLVRDHAARLEALLAPARARLHARPRRRPTSTSMAHACVRLRAFRNLVRLVDTWGAALKVLVGTNPRCRRLGGWPDALYEIVEEPGFVELPWEAAQERLRGSG